MDSTGFLTKECDFRMIEKEVKKEIWRNEIEE